MAQPTRTTQQRESKMNDMIQDLSIIASVYADKPTPSNKIKVLNLQNRIRHEKYRVNKSKLITL